MKKPLIGVTCNYDFRDEAGRVNGQGAIGQDWNFVAADYIRSLEWAGALPVVIPQFDDAANIQHPWSDKSSSSSYLI